MAKSRSRTKSRWRRLWLAIAPHEDNNHHPHAIRHSALAIYIAALLTFNVGYNIVVAQSSQVLGFATSISQQEVIRLTNVERQKAGVGVVQENALLNQSAMAKARNMFEEDYWAHYAPSGKSPWFWYDQVGYAYTVAGENLARDFNTSQGVINGWMNSPSHRDNMLSGNYQHIGIAVLNGVLGGKETTLVVQHFGTQATQPAAAPPSNAPPLVQGSQQGPSQPQATPLPQVNEATITGPQQLSGAGVRGVPVSGVEQSWAQLSYRLLNPLPASGWSIQQIVVISTLAVLMILFIFDFAVLHRQGVHRPNSHSLLHAGMMGIALIVVVYSTAGGVL